MPAPFTTLSGIAAPLPIENLDTDVIIPVPRLIALPPERLGDYALESLRLRADGSRNPEFILNQPPFDGASILVGGANFGCGSSREAAVWALAGIGIRCIIAPSFGGIFQTNCFENGLLPIALDAATCAALREALVHDPTMTVDLERRQIRAANRVIDFEMDALWRELLLAGLDQIGLTLRHGAAVADWQSADQPRRPWLADARAAWGRTGAR
jgi:3-isopropylmalate/(R)-2-methylmalate dehydratase small subunit